MNNGFLGGKQWTEQWIDNWYVCDNRGFEKGRHIASGVMTYEAKYWAHVCFDYHQDIGRKVHFMPMESLRKQILKQAERKVEPVFGTSQKVNDSGIGIKDTGAGYLVNPRDVENCLGLSIESYVPKNKNMKESELAMEIVKNRLREAGFIYKDVSHEQYGIDIMFYGRDDYSVEIKSRGSSFTKYEKLFIQISETNPEKIYV